MKTLLLCLSLFVFYLGTAQKVYSDVHIRDMGLADFDGDGIKDVYYCGWSYLIEGEDISEIYINGSVFPAFEKPSSIAAGDFGEGFVDVVAISEVADIFVGPSSAEDIVTLTSYTWIEVMDADGDGDTDIVVTGNKTVWLENDGSGNFIAEHYITTSAKYIDIYDYEGDGDMDLLLSSGDFLWKLNDGSGNFTETINLGSVPNGYENAVAFQYFSNPEPEVYFKNYDGDDEQWKIKFFSGGGGFEEIIGYFNLSTFSSPSVAFGELVTELGPEFVYGYETDPFVDGTQTTQIATGAEGAFRLFDSEGYDIHNILVEDFDGDGDDDILISGDATINVQSNFFWLWENEDSVGCSDPTASNYSSTATTIQTPCSCLYDSTVNFTLENVAGGDTTLVQRFLDTEVRVEGFDDWHCTPRFFGGGDWDHSNDYVVFDSNSNGYINITTHDRGSDVYYYLNTSSNFVRLIYRRGYGSQASYFPESDNWWDPLFNDWYGGRYSIFEIDNFMVFEDSFDPEDVSEDATAVTLNHTFYGENPMWEDLAESSNFSGDMSDSLIFKFNISNTSIELDAAGVVAEGNGNYRMVIYPDEDFNVETPLTSSMELQNLTLEDFENGIPYYLEVRYYIDGYLIYFKKHNDNFTFEDFVFGCTSPNAENYNPLAIVNDGSCILAGDFDNDGTVGAADLAAFLSGFGTACDSCSLDLTGDGYVTATDLSLFLTLLGT